MLVKVTRRSRRTLQPRASTNVPDDEPIDARSQVLHFLHHEPDADDDARRE